MKLFFNYSFLSAMLIIQSCTSPKKYSKEQLWTTTKSNNVDSIIISTIEIQKAKDLSMIDAVIYNSDDPRVIRLLKYKGMSVYQIKMLTIKFMTGITPSKEITYEVDTAIVNFYKKSAKEMRAIGSPFYRCRKSVFRLVDLKGV